MKIFIQDNGFAGMIIVVAETEERARQFMWEYHNYDPKKSIQSFEIEYGFSYSCLGDC